MRGVYEFDKREARNEKKSIYYEKVGSPNNIDYEKVDSAIEKLSNYDIRNKKVLNFEYVREKPHTNNMKES